MARHEPHQQSMGHDQATQRLLRRAEDSFVSYSKRLGNNQAVRRPIAHIAGETQSALWRWMKLQSVGWQDTVWNWLIHSGWFLQGFIAGGCLAMVDTVTIDEEIYEATLSDKSHT